MDLRESCRCGFDHLACFCTHVLGLVSATCVQLLKKKSGYEKNNDRRPLKLSVRNFADEWGSIWVSSTWNSNYANTLIFGILGEWVQNFYSQSSYTKRIFPILLNNNHTTRKDCYFSDFWDKQWLLTSLKSEANLVFKYLVCNLMASFLRISVSPAQLKIEFTNQHHMKCRPNADPAPISLCLSHDMRAALR